jgi:hypothetical protein
VPNLPADDLVTVSLTLHRSDWDSVMTALIARARKQLDAAEADPEQRDEHLKVADTYWQAQRNLTAALEG